VANLTQNAFLLDQSTDLAMLEERQRIARDPHDSVIQMIYPASQPVFFHAAAAYPPRP
jgi:signal transduction histidine kinase